MKTYLVICLLFGLPGIIHGFDFYVFAQQWSDVFCKVNNFCRASIADRKAWTIHGLWPSDKDSQGPEYCGRSSSFDINRLKSIEDQLKRDWPSYTKSNKNFWEHEWKKHGRCAGPPGDDIKELAYFRKALQLKEKFNIYRVLKENKIVPSPNKLYKVLDIQKALKKSFGVNANVICKTEKKITYLVETRVCLDIDFAPVDCNLRNSCKMTAYLKYFSNGGNRTIQYFGSIQLLLFSLLFLLLNLL